MGDDTLNPAQAIAMYRKFATDERVYFVPEPGGPGRGMDLVDELARYEQQPVDRCIPGRIRHEGRPSLGNVRQGNEYLAGFGFDRAVALNPSLDINEHWA